MHNRDAEEMPLRDRLYMNPIDKFRIYGRFPWVLCVAVSLAFCTSFQVILVITTSTNYSYYQMQLWNDIFLNRDIEGENSVIINSYNIFNLVKLRKFFKETVDVIPIQRYYHINKYTIDNYEHSDLEKNEPTIRMYINYLDRDKAFERGLETKYFITEQDLGPFDHYNPKEFVNIIDSFLLEFSFKHKLNDDVPTSSSCYTWRIYQNYNYYMHGPMMVSLNFDRGVCDKNVCIDYLVNFSRKYYGLNFIILVLAITQATLTISQIYRRTSLLSTVQNYRATTTNIIWESLEFKEKIKFIDLWVIFALIGNICQILGSLSILIIGGLALNVNESVIGLGCFFSWINIIQHMKQYHTTYIVIDTLSRSFHRFGPFICGVLPIFVAFVLLGMCLFWKTGNYSNISDAMIISYTMVNGDSLFQNMSQNYQAAGFFGEIYCYAFLLFFISVVQNIFIAIIVDGFQSLRSRPIDKTGNEAVINDIQPSINISLQNFNSLKEDKAFTSKNYLGQKSKMAFKKILDKSEPISKDKTKKYLEKIEERYKAIVKDVDRLVRIRDVQDKEVDNKKVCEIIDRFLKTEVPDLVETVVSL